MPYYGMGDYYQGDYYQGDPGIFGSILKLGAGALKTFTPAGRIAGIAGKALGALRKPSTALARTVVAAPLVAGAARMISMRPPPMVNGGTMIPRPGIKGGIQRFLPFGETGYYKRRRMNVTNAKALRRAIRRATGFAKLARKVLSFVDARAPRGRARFKKKRR